MTRKYTIIALISIYFYACHKNTKLKQCAPEDGRFIKGQHFILGNLMNNDKRIDYHKWYRQFRAKLHFQSSCIPVQRKKSLEEKLDDLTEVADLSR